MFGRDAFSNDEQFGLFVKGACHAGLQHKGIQNYFESHAPTNGNSIDRWKYTEVSSEKSHMSCQWNTSISSR